MRQQLETLARQQLARPASSPGIVLEESLEEARIREDLEDLHLSQEADRRKNEMRRIREMERWVSQFQFCSKNEMGGGGGGGVSTAGKIRWGVCECQYCRNN